MSDLTSTMKVVVDPSGARTGARQVTDAIESMASKSNNSIKGITVQLNTFNTVLNKVQRSSFGFLKGLLSAAAVGGFVDQMIRANQALASFMAISKVNRGSLEAAGESFDYIRQVSDTLGVSLETNIRTFGKFEAAMRPIDKTGELTKHMFEGLSVAAGGLHLSAYQLELAFKAIEQAASKNKPTLEEFQRQLAEHIPGAMAYLAEGVGLRMDQIHNAISKGTVSIRDLLTGFANVLKAKFGDAAEYAAKQLPAALERLRNAYFLFLTTISTQGGAEGVKAISSALIDLMNKSNITQAIGRMFEDLGGAIGEFIRSITVEDINQLSSAIQTVSSVLVTFVKNIKTIFEMLMFGIVGKYIGLLATHFMKISTAAKLAGGGISVLSGSMLALRAALGGPAGVVALIASLIPLLAGLNRDDAADKIKMDLINKQRMLKTYEQSINSIVDAQAKIGKSDMPVDQKIEAINKLFLTKEKLVMSYDKLYKDLNGPNSTNQEFQQLLEPMPLPGDTPTGAGNGKKTKDPLAQYLDDTTIKRMEKFNELIGILNDRFKGGDPTKLSREQYELWAQTFKKIEADFVTDVFGDGAFKTFDSDVAEMIRKQQDDINSLNADLYAGSEELKNLQKNYARDLESLSNELFGENFAQGFSEVSDWIQDQIKALDKMQISPQVRKELVNMINTIADVKYKLAELDGIQKTFSKSQAIISSKEQELQARVITGLMSESAARVQLRTVIGEQGEALKSGLIPIIENLIRTTTDPAMIASLRAITNEIEKMVHIGSQTNAFQGIIDGLKEVANYSTDTFQSAYDFITQGFQSLEDSIVEFARTGKITLSDFVDSVIGDFARMFAKEAISKPLSQALLAGIGAATSGSAGAAGGSAGGGGFDLLSGVSSFASTFMAPGAISTEIGMMAGGIAEMAGATSAMAGSIGTFVAQAIPYIGVAVALFSIFSKSKPSNKAAFGDIDLSTGQLSNIGNQTGKKQASKETMDARDSILQSIGGWSSILKGLGADVVGSIRADIGERDGIQFAKNGGKLQSYGSDPNAALIKLFKEMAAEATNLEEPFKTLIALFEGTAEGLINFGVSLITLQEYISADPLQAVADLAEQSGKTAWDTWQEGVIKVNDLAKAFDGSLDSAVALGNATIDIYKQEIALIQQIQGLMSSISEMFMDTIKGIQYDMLQTDAEKYDYLRTEADKYFLELQTATDPARIEQLTTWINDLINQAWGLLDQTQRGNYGMEFIQYTNDVNSLANERLKVAQDTITASHDETAKSMEQVMMDVALAMKDAADKQVVAANTPVQVEVTVNNNGSEVGWATTYG